jgi:cysteine synthase A
MESMNPGGTGKDRATMYMLREALKSGQLKPGGCVYEGTSGSTGISLASLCNAKGYGLKIVMPDDQALEKRQLVER